MLRLFRIVSKATICTSHFLSQLEGFPRRQSMVAIFICLKWFVGVARPIYGLNYFRAKPQNVYFLSRRYCYGQTPAGGVFKFLSFWIAFGQRVCIKNFLL